MTTQAKKDLLRIAVTNAVYVVAMAVTMLIIRQGERGLEGLFGICVLVYALTQVGLIVAYGQGMRRLSHVFADQALLLAFALWIAMYGTFQALTQYAAGIDPTSDATFGVIVLAFPLVAITTNLLLGAVAPRLLAKK